MINRCKTSGALLLPIKGTAWHHLQILGVAPRVSRHVISSHVRDLPASATVLAPLSWRTEGQLQLLAESLSDLDCQSRGRELCVPIVYFPKLKISSLGEPQL